MIPSPIPSGMIAMTERKDISRQRLSDFLAARLRARGIDKLQAAQAIRVAGKAALERPEKKGSTAPAS
jgi:hypothetical protein